MRELFDIGIARLGYCTSRAWFVDLRCGCALTARRVPYEEAWSVSLWSRCPGCQAALEAAAEAARASVTYISETEAIRRERRD